MFKEAAANPRSGIEHWEESFFVLFHFYFQQRATLQLKRCKLRADGGQEEGGLPVG